MFGNLPTGYRILNRSKIKTRQLPNEEVKALMSKVLHSLPAPTMNDREAAITQSLNKVLA